MHVPSGQRLLFISLLIVAFFGCKTEKEDPIKLISGGELESKFEKLEGRVLLDEASLLLGEDVFYASLDYYTESSEKSLAVISTEVKSKTTYGVKFALIEFKDDIAELKFSTDFLDGIKETSDFGLKEISEINKTFLFYNSGSSFIGSAGGELFLYLFEIKKGELFTFYFIEEYNKINIELSENLKSEQSILIRDWLFNEAQNIIPEISEHRGKEFYIAR
jgi:hypothetical protein